MKDPLAKFTIVISGDFGEKRSHENLKRWIENNGGKVTSSNSTSVTHLICSKEHWKKQHPTGMSSNLSPQGIADKTTLEYQD